ncbi:hypothetical protein Ahy_B05g075738 isoform B [Arachis hypogaea]|uniref:Cyclic nucleotide-binding domain-containing protein n=2 Tax=Arachis hypogaea TaxID=3818 RepID=A0A444Z1V9_ARAHY|nr:hypothetical protein Ahy_B05g075738 isoform B [Arachis hypogaea]
MSADSSDSSHQLRCVSNIASSGSPALCRRVSLFRVNMANLEIEEEPMLSSNAQSSHELKYSSFRRILSRRRSASMYIPMVSMEPYYNREPSLGEHSRRQLNSVRTFPPKIDELYATLGTQNIFKQSGVTVTENSENNWDDNYDWEHTPPAVSVGQQGLICNNYFCIRVGTHDNAHQGIPRTPSRFDQEYHDDIHGDEEGFVKKVLSFISSCIPKVISPHSKRVKQWNKIIAIFCLVAIFLNPLFFFIPYVQKDFNCIVINWTRTIPLVVLRSLNDLVYFLNILLQFRLAYVSASTGSRVIDIVDHPKEIAMHYLHSYFLLDLFVVIPLPQIIILFVLPKYLGSSGANHSKNLISAVILVQYIPRLFRFLPLLIGQSPAGIIFESAWASCTLNLLIFMLSGHIVGSCWYLFGLQRVNQCLLDACHNAKIIGCMKYVDCGKGHSSHQTQDLWTNNVNATSCLNSLSGAFDYGIYADVVRLTTGSNLIKKYLYALFWGFQQISTLAGNLTPSDFELEVLFTMIIIGLGLLLFALLIGNIQNFLQSLGQRTLEMQLRSREVEQWMNQFHLSEDLRKRIRHAERYNWVATIGMNAQMLMENMPEDLQRDIRRHLFEFIKKIRIFSLMDEPILDAICERLRQKVYFKGSTILHPGDLVEKMFFVLRGELKSIGEDGTRVFLTERDACGEELLIWCLENSSVSTDGKKAWLPGPRLLSRRTVTCLTNVEVYSIGAADLEAITIRFTRFLRNPPVQRALRFESPYLRSVAATRIQVAWRKYRERQLKRALSQANYY